MTKYRLNSAEKVQVTLNNVPKTIVRSNGQQFISYSNYIRLAPNVTYQTNDEAMLKFFRTYKRKVRYNTELENALKMHNVPYEIEWCKSCSGRVKKISYQVVEVFDE